ncbi:hypothetical protein [Kosakonia sp. MUSA4]|uniref:hypothetical protein n=1 Tax=Kosakonia sp. MUSA4 TaxID=2067958 RepID=UPI0015987140|nr:hypothetical protein [Kosakonia sp. MUSA4]QJT82561.1 hypothetical protein C0557_22030 [Kosakonia sp. MUSA4]
MSKSGFDADDLSVTLARFAGKRRDIVYDEAKLKRKAPEPVVFSSATQDCGSVVLTGMATILTETPQQIKRNDEWAELKRKEDEDRYNSFYYYK